MRPIFRKVILFLGNIRLNIVMHTSFIYPNNCMFKNKYIISFDIWHGFRILKSECDEPFVLEMYGSTYSATLIW